MSSATKTLQLLSYFTATRPEIGLSQLCRLAKRDKATTHRHLQALEDAGFVEQNPDSKQYRLGPALLQLARTRELTVPRKAGAEAALSQLAEVTGETTHASILSGEALFSLASCESTRHSTRVVIDLDRFPLHATASGHCALAFGPPALMDALTGDIKPFTAHTIQSPEALQDAVQSARNSGFGRTRRSFEADVSSLSAPLFDSSGGFAGAVSVACVASRFTPELEQLCQQHLITASRDITRNWGGEIPPALELIWAKTLSTSDALEHPL
ncbi:MAG: IclR family transcriptional regulator [Sulfitobacter sp.]